MIKEVWFAFELIKIKLNSHLAAGKPDEYIFQRDLSFTGCADHFGIVPVLFYQISGRIRVDYLAVVNDGNAIANGFRFFH